MKRDAPRRDLFLLVLPSGFVVCLLTLFLGSSVRAAPIRWEVTAGGNGHLYEVVLFECPGGGDDCKTWADASAAAQALGAGWHLATITSQEENDFVLNLFEADEAFWNDCVTWGSGAGVCSGPWIGGFADGGSWKWVTGEPFTFDDWGPSQPYGDGDRIHFGQWFDTEGTVTGTQWNDMPDDFDGFPAPSGYIAEVVPEPTTALLLACGLAGLAVAGRSRSLH